MKQEIETSPSNLFKLTKSAKRKIICCIFANQRSTEPTESDDFGWSRIARLHQQHDIRPTKPGPMLGCYTLKEGDTRCDASVTSRACIQLDIDTEGEKEKTGRIIKVTKPAPPIDEVRLKISQYEWVAASSHWHEPQRGVIKYRITMLPDRDIQQDEYEPLLEALDEILNGALDRNAWQWSQAFYLPSCPAENEEHAFFKHNIGILLPVDKFVSRGREILNKHNDRKPDKKTKHSISEAILGAPQDKLLETTENIERVTAALETLPADCDRDTWLRIVFAIESLEWICGEHIARQWSMTSDKYNEDSFDTLWQSFDPNRVGGIKIGTLFHMANEVDWVDPRSAQAIANPEQHITGAGGDITNGRLFANLYKDKLVYIPELGAWLIFSKETGWLITPFGEVERAAKAVVQMMREHAAGLYKKDAEDRKTKRLMAHVEASSKMPKLRDLIDAAKSEPGMSRSLNEFDADPMLLGLANGVFNLRTGQILPITPDILVTKRCNVTYDHRAKCPRFDQFITEIQPDPVLRSFLQCLAGYLLTGQISEQIFVFMYGLGANGKSVFIELLAWLMGDYSRKIATEMLMHHQRSPQGPSPDIVALKGIRLAYTNETEEGRRLAEARVKDMTGGDTLTGRVPYAKADITFQPTHKLLMVGNHKPEITDSSFGMWRRVVLIDFGVTIPKAQQDKHLLDKLKAEGPGILNWMLEGARQWQQNGLHVPKQVQDQSQAYRDEQDIIGEWIIDHCKKGDGYTEDKKILYGSYKGWMVSNGHHPLAQGRLTRRLNERGYKLQPDKRTVAGLKLKPSIRGHYV